MDRCLETAVSRQPRRPSHSWDLSSIPSVQLGSKAPPPRYAAVRQSRSPDGCGQYHRFPTGAAERQSARPTPERAHRAVTSILDRHNPRHHPKPSNPPSSVTLRRATCSSRCPNRRLPDTPSDSLPHRRRRLVCRSARPNRRIKVPILHLIILRQSASNDPRRNPHGDRAGWYVSHNNSTHSNKTVIANCHTLMNCYRLRNPTTATNVNSA